MNYLPKQQCYGFFSAQLKEQVKKNTLTHKQVSDSNYSEILW